MAELSFCFPGKILFGSDVMNLVGSLTASFGNRAMLIADDALHEGRHIEKVQDILRKRSIDCILRDDVASSSRRGIQDITELAKASRTQVFLGLGGASVLNLARKTACLASGQKSREGLPLPLPYIEIPSVFRNPYMICAAYVDTDPYSHRPVLARSAEGLPQTVVMDPGITAGLSPKFMGTLMLDTLLLAMEGYISASDNFFADAQYLTAIGLLGEGINEAVRGVKDLRPRVKACQAGVLCAFGTVTAGIRAGSILSLSLHSIFGVPASFAAAILLPHILDILAETRTERMAMAAKALGEDTFGMETGAAARRVPEWVRRVIAQMGLPGRLRDLDLKLNELIDAAEAASEFDPTIRLPLTIDGLYDILKSAY
ncbi:MAG: iron-containing alcohol dehydrogenase [Spirochaetaceae bacterium]|nr:iron-containing alcohol dehydrogenase [Spirochaetaceae bacterium]